MRAWVINLKGEAARWAHMSRELVGNGVSVERVEGVVGGDLELPMPEYSEGLFRYFHGRGTNKREIGCYLSHLRAWDLFLASGDESALICEDDLQISPAFAEVLRECLAAAPAWDVLRLSGLRRPQSLAVRPLGSEYQLCVTLARLKGAGAYLISRSAALRLRTALLPMRLPFDHAIDREWFFGLRAAVVLPFPVCQNGRRFRSSIQGFSAPLLGRKYRWLGTYPYQIFNELARYVARAWQFLSAPRRAVA